MPYIYMIYPLFAIVCCMNWDWSSLTKKKKEPGVWQINLTLCGLVTHLYAYQWDNHCFLAMICCPFDAKAIHGTKMINNQSDLENQTNFKHRNWKCRLQNGGHFVQVSMSLSLSCQYWRIRGFQHNETWIKWLPFCWRHFQMHYLKRIKKKRYVNPNFTEICSRWSNSQ